MSRKTLLEARNVHVWYQRGLPAEIHALDAVSVQVQAGDRVGLMGSSGSGKSTLLHVLCRLQEAHAGTLQVGAGDAALPSLVFQFSERQLFAESVRDEVAYGLRQAGLTSAEIDERVRAALADVGLPFEHFAQRSPFRLSGGEMRRTALAGVLAQRRAIVLFDEPTLGLDAEGTARLTDILQRLHARGVACWIASHDADFIAAHCDRLVVLNQGRVNFEGAAADFWQQPDRATALGVRLPSAARVASKLRSLSQVQLPELPDAHDLVRALRSLAQRS